MSGDYMDYSGVAFEPTELRFPELSRKESVCVSAHRPIPRILSSKVVLVVLYREHVQITVIWNGACRTPCIRTALNYPMLALERRAICAKYLRL